MKCPIAWMITWVVLVPGAAAHADVFQFDDFSDTSALQLNNGAAAVGGLDGSALRLAALGQTSNGSAFTLQQFDVSRFATHFTFQITEPWGMADVDGEVGADGIVFIMQPLAPDKIGAAGGHLGYAFGGMTPSVAVEFDTFRNYDPTFNFYDPDSNHVAVDLNGDVSHKAGTPPTAGVTPRFDNEEVWDAWIAYDGTTLTVMASPSSASSNEVLLSYDVDIPTALGQQTAYVGFSSAIAGSTGNHDILSWRFDTDPPVIPEPSTALMLAGGAVSVALILLHRRRHSGHSGHSGDTISI
jgi:hypothetical protein